MEIKFREANIDDVSKIVALCDECFEEKTDIKMAEQNFFKTKNSDNDIYVIGEYKGEVVAHAKITVVVTMFEKTGVFSFLNHVCVSKKCRGFGIATELLNVCEKISRNHGCSEMRLWSLNKRVDAHSCYTKFGFIELDAKCFSKKI